MATVTVSNLTTSDIVLRDAYVMLPASKTITFSRSMPAIEMMSALFQLKAAGVLNFTVDFELWELEWRALVAGNYALLNTTRRSHTAVMTASSTKSQAAKEPTLVAIGPTLVSAFTLGTDAAYRQFKVPYTYAGNGALHVHWTKTTDAVENGKTVLWRVTCLMTPSSSLVHGDLTATPTVVDIPDVYNDSGTTSRILHATADVPINDLVGGYYASMKIEAVTPGSGTPLAEPGLFSLDLEYDEYINK